MIAKAGRTEESRLQHFVSINILPSPKSFLIFLPLSPLFLPFLSHCLEHVTQRSFSMYTTAGVMGKFRSRDFTLILHAYLCRCDGQVYAHADARAPSAVS